MRALLILTHSRIKDILQPKSVRKATPQPCKLPDVSIDNFVGEEAPEACGGPRSPDVFYRGEEAGTALKSTDKNEMQQLIIMEKLDHAGGRLVRKLNR